MEAAALNIVVLHGGPTAERVVSLASGQSVAQALQAEGQHVHLFDPNPDLGTKSVCNEPEYLEEAEAAIRRFDWSKVDVVFNALHGPFGEDGQLQSLLDRLDVCYTGSRAAASRAGFRKAVAKRRFQVAGVSTPRGVEVTSDDPLDRLEIAAERLGYPVVMKPEAQGSSIGVSIITRPDGLETAAAGCFAYGDRALLEEYIAGTEWTVPIWDDVALPLIQIVPHAGFFDFAAKYNDERTEYRFEFDGDAELIDRINEVGRRAARALGAEGLSRADIRVRPNGDPYVLEINTSPGMTDHSLVPKSAEKLGLSLGELCIRECRRALRRRRQRLAA
jgi:D-alanine-D-alanine ligase